MMLQQGIECPEVHKGLHQGNSPCDLFSSIPAFACIQVKLEELHHRWIIRFRAFQLYWNFINKFCFRFHVERSSSTWIQLYRWVGKLGEDQARGAEEDPSRVGCILTRALCDRRVSSKLKSRHTR